MNELNNYTPYHIHTDLSNGTTIMDSVTKFGAYIERAKECGMKAFGFSEHGSVFEWWHKKCEIEKAGMKYLHCIEVYLTETMEEKVRDNYHCVLIAKNLDGLYEINRLASRAFGVDDIKCIKKNKDDDNHFYYSPRISFDELFNTSENIIVTSACVASALCAGDEKCKQKMLDFFIKNKHRCFLEIQHHKDEKQVVYNKKLWELSKQYGIPLIAGTDTHALNEAHEKGRSILQISKKIHFEGEENWDLKFKTFDELVEQYRIQNALPKDVYMEAIANTNVMADMVEEIVIDKSAKYPHISDNPIDDFNKKVENAVNNHKYIQERYSKKEIEDFVEEETNAYIKSDSISFLLLQTYLREWEKKHGIKCGYSRGSVSGSMLAYALNITEMDSKKFGLNFFRFCNPDRVSLADIDTDYGEKDRAMVKEFLLKDHMDLPQIITSEIITFNTIAGKGAIRDVGRALGVPIEVQNEMCSYLEQRKKINSKDEVIGDNSKLVEDKSLEEVFEKFNDYDEYYEYVKIVYGTITSIGSHPSGVVVSDLNIAERIGLCTTSSSNYPISMLNMKELDDLMFVKLDILGLSNIDVVNQACELAGIERLNPDNVNLEDEKVWKSIRDDTTLIFQWESPSAQAYLRKFFSDNTIAIAKKMIPNFSYIKWLSFGNGLLRPACGSFRDNVANGEFYDNGFNELNEFLAPEAGRIAMQETIMRFLVQFCGYSNSESDTVRRAIAKKKGTETLLPEIEKRFIDYSSTHYDITKEECAEVIKPFIQVIMDASAYAFSWNHSDSYSVLGYVCGYLRYYYPLEFLTASLNTFDDNKPKTGKIIKYAKKQKIKILPPKFGISKSEYFYSYKTRSIAKGVNSVKFMNKEAAEELYNLSQSKKYNSFLDLLIDINKCTSVDARQLDVLIKIDYFSDFGNQRELFEIVEQFEYFKKGEAKQIRKDSIMSPELKEIIEKYSTGLKKNGEEAVNYTLLDVYAILKEIEQCIMSKGIKDLDDRIKMENFKDLMGYSGYYSGKEEDRRKLLVKDVFPLKRKKDGKQFGYSVTTQSLGSGVEGRFTVYNSTYNCDPIKKDELIYCLSFERDKSYFILRSYKHIY